MGSNMEVYKDLILAVLVLKLQIVGLSIINSESYIKTLTLAVILLTMMYRNRKMNL